MKKMTKEFSNKKERLKVLLEVRDTFNQKCILVPTPSTSVTPPPTGETNWVRRETGPTYGNGLNDGQVKAMNVVMSMIEEVAKFVTICCGENGISMIDSTKIKDGWHGRCYTICSKCKKECECEWRIKEE